MGIRNFIRLDVTGSTNSVALEAGRQGAASGTVVVAAAQTAGRGRLDRAWLSPPGMGLYFSLILRPELSPEQLPKVTLAAGVAVCRAVETEYGVRPRIKWPNDLLLEGKKFGGILSETGTMHNISPSQPQLVVVGVGLNLFPPAGGFAAELRERATALSFHVDRPLSSDLLLDACLVSIEETVHRLEKGDFPGVLGEWQQREAFRGKMLSWITPRGQKVTGVSLGPDADGILHIRDQAGTIHRVLSGDLNLAGKILQ